MINETKALDLIKRQKATGLTITAFCANEGIPKSSFYYWRKKLSDNQCRKFIPLLVNTTPATMMDTTKNYIGSRNEPHTSDDFLFELSYPNGTRLRVKSGFELDNLRLLVSLLD
ncbi:MAG: hypothetical protein GT600_15280 [Bacteroidales bacterium]|jgi:hypothetical protein|nr:hypothetical protein [Bacteroidales bacterium]OQB60618.1 MAG: hypothetical protein BWX96_02130 [Bacteroidetes bacterium ADurb.Bin145]